MAERAGLDGRTSRRSQQSGCKCGVFVKLCFHYEVQHGHLCPEVLVRFAASFWHTSSVTSNKCIYPLSEQFSKYANLFFLFTACIQQIPGVSPTNKWTTIAPLSAVLLASAFKEVQEDLVRCGIHLLSLLTHLTWLETTSIRRRSQFQSCQSAYLDRLFRLDKMAGYQSW